MKMNKKNEKDIELVKKCLIDLNYSLKGTEYEKESNELLLCFMRSLVVEFTTSKVDVKIDKKPIVSRTLRI